MQEEHKRVSPVVSTSSKSSWVRQTGAMLPTLNRWVVPWQIFQQTLAIDSSYEYICGFSNSQSPNQGSETFGMSRGRLWCDCLKSAEIVDGVHLGKILGPRRRRTIKAWAALLMMKAGSMALCWLLRVREREIPWFGGFMMMESPTSSWLSGILQMISFHLSSLMIKLTLMNKDSGFSDTQKV